MKAKSVILSGLFILSLTFTLTSFVNIITSPKGQTEEYAVVDVVEFGKKKLIRVTIGTDPTTETEWKSEKTDARGDYTPVIKELNQLNEQGFELLNCSLAFEIIHGNTYGARQTFMMVKKVK